MNPLSHLLSELRDRKLLPIAGLLLVAIIAVPVALSKTTSAPPAAPPAAISAGVPGAASLPAVSVRGSVTQVKLGSKAHNPFNQGRGATVKVRGGGGGGSRSSSTAKQASSGGSSSKTSGQSSGSGGSGSSSASNGTSSTTTTTSTTTTAHVVAPRTLAGNEAYTVTVGISQGSGLFTLPGVERLRPLPSASRSLLLPLGVLRGGNRVLFAVLAGAVVSGPGRCVPGGVDCEVLVLAPNQIEHLSLQTTSGRVSVADFAVTAIHVKRFSSVAAAQAARRAVSAQGDGLLHRADLPAVDLFPFDPSLGALVDQRNLNAGGN